MQNTLKILMSLTSGTLIGIGLVLLMTLHGQIMAFSLGGVMLLSGILGIYLIKRYSKLHCLICLAVQALIGLGVFSMTASTNQHIFNLVWSFFVVGASAYSIYIVASNRHA